MSYSLTRVALVLLVIHYTAEAVLHASRLFHFADKTEMAGKGQSATPPPPHPAAVPTTRSLTPSVCPWLTVAANTK